MIIKAAINVFFNVNKSGVYVLGSIGGTGKSYIVSVLKDIVPSHPELQVVLISPNYNEGKVIGDIKNARYVYVDRADLLLLRSKERESFLSELIEIAKDKCILVDFKNFSTYGFVPKFASVKMYSDRIEVNPR